jgi:hypothetical protein
VGGLTNLVDDRPKTSDEDLQQKLDCLWLNDLVHPVELGYVILLTGLKRLATGC